MLLHDVFDGRVVATDHRRVLRENAGSELEVIGTLPPPPSGFGSVRHRLMMAGRWNAFLERLVGAVPTVTARQLAERDLIATVGPWITTSHDGGRTWHRRRRLPSDSGPRGVLPTGICHHDGMVYVGEYLLDRTSTPRILRSTDSGRTWSTVLGLDDVRHVHGVQVDPYSGELWVTTGDADDECWIGRLRDGEFEAVGGGSQRWRAVALAFTPTAVLWGVDCVYAAANPVMKLDRDAFDDARPEPTPVHRLPDSVYYASTLTADGEPWVVLSTAAETSNDSTAPDRPAAGTGTVRVVAASAASAFTEWFEVVRYRKRRCLLDRHNPGGRLPVANAYAFLASHPERGLFVNPYNTATADGSIRRFPPGYFARLGP